LLSLFFGLKLLGYGGQSLFETSTWCSKM